MRRVVVVSVLLLVMMGFVAYHQLESYLTTPMGAPQQELDVVSGATLGSVLSSLAERSIISRPRWLYYYARFTGKAKIHKGRYLITSEHTPLMLLSDLAVGRVITEKITIVEGHNRWQIRDRLVAGGWMTAEEFDRFCDDPTLLDRYNVPGPSCEGYLYPETYSFASGTRPEVVFGVIFAAYRSAFDEISVGAGGPLKLSERELVTLASIVEKETGAAHERPRIACVFYNRLRANPAWRLETDPTVIYAATLLNPDFDGNIKRYHLREMNHPYNTYRVFGLPPGPIASPGRAALMAVFAPTQCSDYFFVSRNNGEHEFCPTLVCHTAAVQKWQVNYFRPRR